MGYIDKDQTVTGIDRMSDDVPVCIENQGHINEKRKNSMEIMEERRGIWLNFPECVPEDGEQVVVKRNGWYEILVYNEHHQCWDDSEGDDYYCGLNEIDKFLRIPKE